jgi:Protein of unknown function (DUF3054)
MKNRYILIIGDLLALGVITMIGFISHGETGPSYLPRMAAVFLPLSVMWFLIAPWFGLFQKEIVKNARQLWRPLLAMFFAGPLAVLLRGFMLRSPVIPIFVFVLSLTSALGLILWRALYIILNRSSWS